MLLCLQHSPKGEKNMTFHITINKEEHYIGIIVEGCVICVEPLVEMGCEEF